MIKLVLQSVRTLSKTIAESSEAGFASDLKGPFIKQIPRERIVFGKSSGTDAGLFYILNYNNGILCALHSFRISSGQRLDCTSPT